MSGRRLTMVARLAVLVMAGGLAGCVVEAVEEPDAEGEAELGLVAGGDEVGAADVQADEDAAPAEEVGGEGLSLPGIYSTPTKGEDVSGDPSPDPWDPDPNSVNTDSESDGHSGKASEI